MKAKRIGGNYPHSFNYRAYRAELEEGLQRMRRREARAVIAIDKVRSLENELNRRLV